ncbi:MAG: hypothetical protein ACU0B1_14010 [Thermohalobaculum sp.]
MRDFARGFPDFGDAEEAGAILRGSDVEELAAVAHLPPRAVGETLAEVARLQAGQGTDPFGRDLTAPPRLAPPFFAVRVTGALFHTQGGLMIDQTGRRPPRHRRYHPQPLRRWWCRLWGLRAGYCGLSLRQRPSDRCRFRRAGWRWRHAVRPSQNTQLNYP